MTAGTQSSLAAETYYDVKLYGSANSPLPTAEIRAIKDDAVSAFVTLPPSGLLLPPQQGSAPPKFADLDAAVKKTLAGDPGSSTAAVIAGLTIDQCRNIASEIVYGGQAQLPTPPEALADMYTSPTNGRASRIAFPNASRAASTICTCAFSEARKAP